MKLVGLSVAAALGLLASTDASLVRGSSSGKDQPHQLSGSRLSLDLEPHHHYTFELFVRDFNKDYVPGSEEFARRKALFLQRLREVQEHNAAHADGKKTFRKGVNEYADWTDAELRGRLGFKPSAEWHRKRQPGLETMSALMEGGQATNQLSAGLGGREQERQHQAQEFRTEGAATHRAHDRSPPGLRPA